MFDVSLDPLFNISGWKSSPDLSHYVQYLSSELAHQANSYGKYRGAETLSIQLLERIIETSDFFSIVRTPDAFSRYSHGIRPILEEVYSIFDPNANVGRVTDFVAPLHGASCLEYLFPVTTDDIFSDLPFGMSWSRWTNVRPLRILCLPTQELTFEIFDNKLTYRHDLPKFGAFSIDVAAFLLKLCAYYDQFWKSTSIDDIKNALPQWIHEHVIFPMLSRDSVNLWLRSQYGKLIKSRTPLSGTFTDYAWISANYGRVGSQYPKMTEGVLQLTEQCENGSIPACALFTSLDTLYGSISQEYHTLHKTVQFPAISQFKWGECLRDADFLDMGISALSLYPHNVESRKILYYLKRDLTLISMSHPWSSLPDSYLTRLLGASIKQQLDDIDAVIQRL